MPDDTLQRLAATIAARRATSAEISYTKSLLEAGIERCARKLGEESLETIIAALSGKKSLIRDEAADLLYHLLVVLEATDVPLDEVLMELERRMGVSGHDEKAARPG